MSDTNSVSDFFKKLVDFERKNFFSSEREEIAMFCKVAFGIKTVVDELEALYNGLL